MNLFLNITIVLGTFTGMEAVAWLTHKYIIHGVFWPLHQDRHLKGHHDFLDRKDFFFLIHDVESVGMLWVSWKYFRKTSKNNPA